MGNTLIGSSRRFVGFDVSVSPYVAAAVLERACRFIPQLRRSGIVRSFAGLRPHTPDGKPIIGESGKVPGYFVAAGHEGEGLGLAPVTGRIIADLILDGSSPFWRSNLSVDRFESGRDRARA